MKTAAGAVLSLSAISANAGIIIPAGDWTLDVSGNVNMYSVWSNGSGTAPIVGGLSAQSGGTNNSMTNGLLPNFLSFSGSTRQNDLDVTFLISLQPGSSNSAALQQVGSASNTQGGLNNRQAFITFGDKSWGSVKIGKDLGIFASDAILNDMTLLGVGAAYGNATTAGNTTLGRIGAGYVYADWKPQIAYTTPNFSGFQATVGITQAFTASGYLGSSNGYDATYSTAGAANANVAYEGKASYSFAANDVTGKVWVSGIAQHQAAATVTYGSTYQFGNNDPMAYGVDIGANANVAGLGLTGYYYYGSGLGTTGQMQNGYGANLGTGAGAARDSYGGYVQATYVLPTKTKVGVSWGTSKLDLADGETTVGTGNLVKENTMWTAGLYHPLTKHLNLVAEYSYVESYNQLNAKNDNNVGSIGAILFF